MGKDLVILTAIKKKRQVTTQYRPLRLTLVLGVLVVAAVGNLWFFRLNISSSVPMGLYRLSAVPTPLARGMLVVLPVPASVQPWQHLPLLKPIAALPGDHVCVHAARLWIRGADYGPVHDQAGGAWLPQWLGCRTLEAGEVFLASTVEKSLDSRYFSPVPITKLTAVAIPVWTWR